MAQPESPPVLVRGDVYWVAFPYVFDRGRRPPIRKLALVLQEGPLFEPRQQTSVVILTTSHPRRPYPYYTFVPASVTGMEDSWIDCSSIYTVERSVINRGSLAFRIPNHIMEDVNDALYAGLCIP